MIGRRQIPKLIRNEKSSKTLKIFCIRYFRGLGIKATTKSQTNSVNNAL